MGAARTDIAEPDAPLRCPCVETAAARRITSLTGMGASGRHAAWPDIRPLTHWRVGACAGRLAGSRISAAKRDRMRADRVALCITDGGRCRHCRLSDRTGGPSGPRQAAMCAQVKNSTSIRADKALAWLSLLQPDRFTGGYGQFTEIRRIASVLLNRCSPICSLSEGAFPHSFSRKRVGILCPLDERGSNAKASAKAFRSVAGHRPGDGFDEVRDVKHWYDGGMDPARTHEVSAFIPGGHFAECLLLSRRGRTPWPAMTWLPESPDNRP